MAVCLSMYTIGATARYDGVELGTVRSAHSVSAAVDQLEEITRQTLSDTDYSIDSAKLEVRTGIVPRKELESTDALEENLTQQLGLVDYAYVLYVEGEPVAATTFPGAIEQLLEQLKKGYITDSTVDCYFVENVEVKQEYVDQSLIMNLGYIAEKLNATKAGEVTYTVKSGDVWSLIAEDNGMTNEELLALNPGYDISVLHTGDVLTISRAVPYLTVVNVERQSYLQDVAYSVEYVDDPDMYQGDYEVLSKGVYGKADVTANVTVINGTESILQFRQHTISNYTCRLQLVKTFRSNLRNHAVVIIDIHQNAAFFETEDQLRIIRLGHTDRNGLCDGIGIGIEQTAVRIVQSDGSSHNGVTSIDHCARCRKTKPFRHRIPNPTIIDRNRIATFRTNKGAIRTAQANRITTSLLQLSHNGFVDQSGIDHSHHFQGLFIGHPTTTDHLRLNTERFGNRGGHFTSSVHQNFRTGQRRKIFQKAIELFRVIDNVASDFNDFQHNQNGLMDFYVWQTVYFNNFFKEVSN